MRLGGLGASGDDGWGFPVSNQYHPQPLRSPEEIQVPALLGETALPVQIRTGSFAGISEEKHPD